MRLPVPCAAILKTGGGLAGFQRLGGPGRSGIARKFMKLCICNALPDARPRTERKRGMPRIAACETARVSATGVRPPSWTGNLEFEGEFPRINAARHRTCRLFAFVSPCFRFSTFISSFS